jgi:hypothetical protein
MQSNNRGPIDNHQATAEIANPISQWCPETARDCPSDNQHSEPSQRIARARLRQQNIRAYGYCDTVQPNSYHDVAAENRVRLRNRQTTYRFMERVTAA